MFIRRSTLLLSTALVVVVAVLLAGDTNGAGPLSQNPGIIPFDPDPNYNYEPPNHIYKPPSNNYKPPDDDVDAKLNELENTVKNLQIDSNQKRSLMKAVDTIKNEVKDKPDKKKEYAGAIKDTATTVIGSIDNFKSGDPIKIMSSVLKITGTLGAFAGPAGPFISGFISIFSGLLSFLGPKEQSIGDLLSSALDKANLEEYTRKAHGVKRKFNTIQIALNAIRTSSNKLSENEILAFNNNINIAEGFDFLTEAGYFVAEGVRDYSEARRRVALAEVLAQIQAIRELLYMDYYNLLNTNGFPNYALAFPATLQDFRNQERKFYTDVLLLPKQQWRNIMLAAAFDERDFPSIVARMNAVGTTDPISKLRSCVLTPSKKRLFATKSNWKTCVLADSPEYKWNIMQTCKTDRGDNNYWHFDNLNPSLTRGLYVGIRSAQYGKYASPTRYSNDRAAILRSRGQADDFGYKDSLWKIIAVRGTRDFYLFDTSSKRFVYEGKDAFSSRFAWDGKSDKKDDIWYIEGCTNDELPVAAAGVLVG